MKERVGILGGSFDPVHCGHVKIASSFLESGLIDRLLILLTPNPPHKQSQNQADFTHRFEMLELAFKSVEKVTVSDIERSLPTPSYTLQTIEHLQNKHPNTIFFLCVGQDSLGQFDQWHRYNDILEKVTLLVAERPGINTSTIDPNILERAVFIEHTPYLASSTSIRREQAFFQNDLPDSVADYIDKHKLYTHL